jgi:hypothetical protein
VQAPCSKSPWQNARVVEGVAATGAGVAATGAGVVVGAGTGVEAAMGVGEEEATEEVAGVGVTGEGVATTAAAAVVVVAGALETATMQQAPQGTMEAGVGAVVPLLETGPALAAATPTLPGAPAATGERMHEQMHVVDTCVTRAGVSPLLGLDRGEGGWQVD